MSEQTFWGTFADFCKANPRQSFEALRPQYEEIQEANKRRNATRRSEYLARLQAEKTAHTAERERLAAVAALAREAQVKRQSRYQHANLTEAQYDAFWPDLYKEFLLAESNRADAEMRRGYQF
jgi:predicted GIY-YIG superfamily endonuclease